MRCTYNKPPRDIAHKHGLNLHLYADDNLILRSCPQEDEVHGAVANGRIKACTAEMRAWIRDNKLQLNDSKTEAMIICSHHNCSKVNLSHIRISDSQIEPTEALMDIGTLLDGTLSMRQQCQLPV